MTEPTSRRLATIQEAAAYVGCHHTTIRRRIKDGSLNEHRLGPKIVRVDLDQLDTLMSAPA